MGEEQKKNYKTAKYYKNKIQNHVMRMKKKVGIRSLRGLCTIIHIEIEPLYIIRNSINLKAAFKI